MLYQLVAGHWSELAEQVGALPRFVVREFEEYLCCGILENGLAATHSVVSSRYAGRSDRHAPAPSAICFRLQQHRHRCFRRILQWYRIRPEAHLRLAGGAYNTVAHQSILHSIEQMEPCV